MIATAARLLILATVLGVTGCQAKSPAPGEILDELKAYVENDGRVATPPGNYTVGVIAVDTPRDIVTVKNIKCTSSMPPLTKEINGIPKGTLMHYYMVVERRVKPDASETINNRQFYVYNADGTWKFLENKSYATRYD
jgi:hypothetical protein